MPRTPKQYEKIREEKRAHIINCALELFAHEGYHTTSISRIAKKANISKGLIYNYFESKEALLQTIFRLGIKQIEEIFDPNKDGVLTKEEFVTLVGESFKMMKENFTFWKLYMTTITQADVLDFIKTEMQTALQPIMQFLYSYYENRGYEDPMAMSMLFGALLDGVGLHYIMNPEEYPVKEITKLIIKKFS